jgi:hypothetical protein
MLGEPGGIMAPNAVPQHRTFLTYAPAMKFPRIIRPDEGGRRPLVPTAKPGEWAVTGTFRYAHRDPGTLRPSELETFKHGWLGLETFGSARLVEVAEITPAEHDEMARRLSAHYMAEFGLENVNEAAAAAAEEMVFAASQCGHPLKTVLALDREFNEQGLIETTRVAD